MNLTGRLLRRGLLAGLVLLALSGLSTGCGVDQAVGPEGNTPPGDAFFALTLAGNRPAAKISAEAGRAICYIGPLGGELVLADDEVSVELLIPQGALEGRELIAMSRHGNRASNLSIVFTPSGLVFQSAAVLRVRLAARLLDMPQEQLATIYHFQENDEVETIRATRIALDGDQLVVEYPIGGFSRYGMARYGD